MKKIEKLTERDFEVFVKANILNAIDSKLLNINFEDLNFDFKIDEEKSRMHIMVLRKDEIIACAEGYINPKHSEANKLRVLMGATMMVFDQMKENLKPVLKVIKGGLNDGQ